MFELFLSFRKLAILGDDNQVATDTGDFAIGLCNDHCFGVASYFSFHSRADDWRFRNQQWDALALHVRSHECPVGIVVFEEGNQSRGDGDELLWRHIHVVNLGGFDLEEVSTVADADLFTGVVAFFVEGGIGLGDEKAFFFVASQEVHLIGDASVFDFAVGSFDKSELVDSGEGRHGRNQSDVRAFWRFDRANSPIVGRMNIADFEACAVAGEASWPEGRKASLVGQFCEWVGLIHELRKL